MKKILLIAVVLMLATLFISCSEDNTARVAACNCEDTYTLFSTPGDDPATPFTLPSSEDCEADGQVIPVEQWFDGTGQEFHGYKTVSCE